MEHKKRFEELGDRILRGYREIRWFGGLIGCIASVGVLAELPVASLERSTPVDFEREVLPFLKANCLACHNETKAKAGLILETPDTIKSGGDSGTSVVPGNPAESLLFQAAAHLDEDTIMPPVGNKSNAKDLTPEQLGLLQLWIAEGAKGEVTGKLNLDWQPVAERVQPVYTMDLSPSGRYVAYGRGSEAMIYEIPSRQAVGQLVDEGLGENRAHLDLVNSIAIHPNGRLIATGGFREIKLWERSMEIDRFGLELPDHGEIEAVSLSGDGLVIAGAAKDGRIGIWNLSTGEELTQIEGGSPVRQLSLSDNGQEVVVYCENGELRRIRRVRGGLNEWAQSVPAALKMIRWRPDGEAFAGVHEDGTVTLWVRSDEEGGMDSRDLGVTDVQSVAFFPGKEMRLALGLSKKGVFSFDLADKKLKPLVESAFAVTDLAFNQNGNGLVLATEDGNAELWDLEKGERVASLRGARPEQHEIEERERVLKLLTGALELAEKEAKALDEELVKENERVTKAEADLKAKTDASTEAAKKFGDAQVAWEAAKKKASDIETELSGAETRLATAQEQADGARREAMGAVARLNGATDASENSAEEVASIHEEIESVLLKVEEFAFEAGQAKAALDRLNDGLEARKKAAKEAIDAAKKTLDAEEKNEAGSKRALAIAENELKLAKKSVERVTERQGDSKKRVEDATLAKSEGETQRDAAKTKLQSTRKPFRGLHFSPRDEWVVGIDSDGTMSLWWAETGDELDHIRVPGGEILASGVTTAHSALVGHRGGQISMVRFDHQWKLNRVLGEEFGFADRVNALDFSLDGRQLASGGGDPSRSGEIKVWDLETMEMTHSLSEVHSDVVFGIQFSPDGKRLASGSADRFARVIDLEAGKTMHSFEGHTHYVMDVSWQSNGRTLVSAGGDGMAKVWDVTTGERKKNIEGFKKEVTGVGFVGDKAEVLASSGDATIAVYGLDGKQIRSMEGTRDFVFAESVSADGRYAAAGTQDGALKVWDLPSGKVLTTVE